MIKQVKLLLPIAALLVTCLCLAQMAPTQRTIVPEYTFKVLNTYPHDPTAFTQGLEYRAGYLYEGTGLNGQSSLRKVDLTTGQVLQTHSLGSQYFGEGITVVNDRILEMTWQSQIGFIYNQATFALQSTFGYPGEGWGLANDGTQIYMSDGSAQIRFWDISTLQEKRRITVHDGQRPITNLNELECVQGEIYANVWLTNQIARISPVDGRVLGWIDLTGIYNATQAETAAGATANGIAYDSLTGRLFVTGKLWSKLFQIALVKKPGRR